MPELAISFKCKDYICFYDQEDHELISHYSWSVSSAGYGQTSIKGRTILMHRLIMDVVDSSEKMVDHKNHDKLDNRRFNLRLCNASENRRNSRKIAVGSSIYKGCYWEKDRFQFHAQIGLGDRVKNLGRYSDERLAGKAYDRKALEVFEDFAYLNFPSSGEAQQLTLPWF
jgi:hypothetical protein